MIPIPDTMAIYKAKREAEEKEKDLRDRFAEIALKELMKHFDFQAFNQDPKRIALWSYDIADEMLKVRKGNDDD